MKSLALFPILWSLVTACGGTATRLQDNAARIADSINTAYRQSHVYVPVTVGDSITGNFIFDTGGSTFYLDSLFFSRHFSGLPVGKATIGGAGNSLDQVPIIVSPLSFSVAGETHSNPMTPVLPLKNILGKKIDGIVGLDLFNGKYIAIDYTTGDFSITESPDTTGYRRIPLTYRDGRLLADARVIIEGKTVAGKFLLDTGSGGTVDLSAPAARNAGLETGTAPRAVYRTTNGGIGGDASYTNVVADDITLDTFHLRGIKISYSSNRGGALASENHTGLLGGRILWLFDVIIDLKGHNLFLRPNRHYGLPAKTLSHGILYVDRTDISDGYLVTGMSRGGAAEKTGLKPGDILTGIDGMPVAEMNEGQVDKLLENTSRDTLTLSVWRDGEKIDLRYKPQPTL